MAANSTQIDADHGRRATGLLGRLYVPLCTVILLVLVGNWLAVGSKFDPLTVAQNRQIRFQTGNEETARVNGLTPVEAARGCDVVRDGFQETSNPNEVVFIGNSQTMAIMDEEPGNLTTPQWLQILLMRQTAATHAPAVVLGSLPNLSMAEFLLRLVAAGEWAPHPARAVVGCLTLREWRGLAIRDSLIQMAATPAIRNALARLIASSPDLLYGDTALSGSIKPGQPADPRGGAKPLTFPERLERDIQNAADKMPLFKMRPYLYWRISIHYMSLRNWLLNIHADTPRPMPETSYRASLQLLELSLRYAKRRGITAVLYLSPIRPVVPNPVLPSDLAKFRKDVLDLCEAYGVTCLDYTDLVPEKLWRNYSVGHVEAGEKDYAHFTGPAHKLVAEKIIMDAGARLDGLTP